MPMPHQNDISIGKDQWITFIDVEGRQDKAANLDPLITPMKDFWGWLETECVAACCGIDAFALWPEDIQRASIEASDPSLPDKLAALRDFVRDTKADIFVSHRLNNYFDRQVILQLLDHVTRHITTATKG